MSITTDFPSAIRELIEGAHITRKAWGDTATWGLLANGFLSIHNAGDFSALSHQWIVNDGDLVATDWVVVWPATD